jgi:hypothetical protein
MTSRRVVDLKVAAAKQKVMTVIGAKVNRGQNQSRTGNYKSNRFPSISSIIQWAMDS